MKKIVISGLLNFLSMMTFAHSKEGGTGMETIKQYISNKDTLPELRKNRSIELVKNVLKRYNSAVATLDVIGTERFFAADSKIYESGGSEGNYAQYMEHHLTPECKRV